MRNIQPDFSIFPKLLFRLRHLTKKNIIFCEILPLTGDIYEKYTHYEEFK